MDAAEITRALSDIFDQAVEYHGFTDYMRDYELIVYCRADPRTGVKPEHVRYVFQKCVYALVETTVRLDVWPHSLDDRLIDHGTSRDSDGYVWGVRWQVLYPGAALVPDSARAAEWSRQVGIPFQEVNIAMNAHRVTLVFADLAVHVAQPGYHPYVVGASGPDVTVTESTQVVSASIAERAPGDLSVVLTLTDGRTSEVSGAPLSDVFAVWRFLVRMVPQLELEVLQRALDEFNPRWEESVAAQLRENEAASAILRGDPTPQEVEAKRRSDIKALWRRQRQQR